MYRILSPTTTCWKPQKSLELNSLWLRGTVACHRCTIETQPMYPSIPDNGHRDYTNIRPRHKTQSNVALRGWSPTECFKLLSSTHEHRFGLTVVARGVFQTGRCEWRVRDVVQWKYIKLKCPCVLCAFNCIHVNMCTALFNRLRDKTWKGKQLRRVGQVVRERSTL